MVVHHFLMSKIILATTSPYRVKAFSELGIPFESVGSNVDESQVGRNNPQELVKDLSKLKCLSVAKSFPDYIVIGMDSVGCFQGNILEKPKSRAIAFERLKTLSGNTHQFYTGVYICLLSKSLENSQVVMTEVKMRNISEEEINKYLDQDPKYNTYALGYDPLGHYSSTFIQRLEGSYNNFLTGIPLEVIVEMLNNFPKTHAL